MATLQADLAAYAKKVFEKDLKKIYPSKGKYPMISRYPMQNKLGAEFSNTVQDKLPAGFTVGTGGKQTLEDSVPAKTFELTGSAYSLYLQDELIYPDMERAAGKNEKAYGKLIFDYGMMIKEAHWGRNELNTIWGGFPLASFPDDAATRVDYTAGTTASVTISADSFVPDAFQNSNMPFDVFTVLTSTGAYTKLNANARVLVTGVTISQAGGSTSVVLHLSGDETDLALLNSTNDAGADRTFEFWFRGARTEAAILESLGFRGLGALVAGDVYRGYTIPAGSVFVPHAQDAAGAQLSKALVEEILMPAVIRGARATAQNPWVLNCSYHGLRDMAQELESGDNNFRMDGKAKQLGNYSFGYMTAAGPVVVEPVHTVGLGSFVAHISDKEYFARIGSVEAEPAYNRMGGQVWQPVPGTNYVSIMSHSDVGLVSTKLAHVVACSGLAV